MLVVSRSPLRTTWARIIWTGRIYIDCERTAKERHALLRGRVEDRSLERVRCRIRQVGFSCSRNRRGEGPIPWVLVCKCSIGGGCRCRKGTKGLHKEIEWPGLLRFQDRQILRPSLERWGSDLQHHRLGLYRRGASFDWEAD